MKTVFFLVFALLFVSANSQKFMAGFLPAPAGYEQASFADLFTPSFVSQYNTIGLSFNQTFAGAVCCVYQVLEGYLTFGGGESYLEPFLAGTDTCTTGLAPKNSTFGIPTFAPGPFSGVWLKTLNNKDLSLLGVNSSIPTLSDCYAGVQHTVVLKATSTPAPPTTTPAPTAPPPRYIVAPYGPNYTAPAGYQKMGLFDFTSTSFINAYNTNGLRLVGNYTANYCCMLQLNDNGWLTYGAENVFSPLTLFVDGYWSCGAQAMGGLVTFGTFFGGAHNNLVFPVLNATTMQLVGEFYNNTKNDFDGCIGFPDSLTMWMLD